MIHLQTLRRKNHTLLLVSCPQIYFFILNPLYYITTAGVLYGLDKSFKPFTYFNLLLPMFAAAIVGGIGSPIGAVIGGYVIAFSEITLTYAYKKFFVYLLPENLEPSGLMQVLSTDYKFAISFIILVIVLIVRPTGIVRGKII